jgi:hypothetical protein
VESSLLTVASGVLGVWLGGVLLQLFARLSVMTSPEPSNLFAERSGAWGVNITSTCAEKFHGRRDPEL